MSSDAQVLGIGRGAHSASADHGLIHFRRGHLRPGVEELLERIAGLVRQRQQLRTSGASRESLEQNRLRLARSQWELCHALIERHSPTLTEKNPADVPAQSVGHVSGWNGGYAWTGEAR
jgi:hypothetical protein